MSSKESDRPSVRGRPRGFDEDRALEAAMMTFWKHGYHGTSLDALVQATGASRASLYQVFGDKRSLYIKSLDLYGTRFEERVRSVMDREPDGRRALKTILTMSVDRLTSSDAPAGCLRCNTTLELMGSDAAIDKALSISNARFTKTIARLTNRSLQAREISRSGAARYPVFITAIVNGLVTLSRSGGDRKTLMLIVKQALDSWPSPAR